MEKVPRDQCDMLGSNEVQDVDDAETVFANKAGITKRIADVSKESQADSQKLFEFSDDSQAMIDEIRVETRNKIPRIRPPVKAHGGKYYLAREIVPILLTAPRGTTEYLEPCAFGASVFLAMPRFQREILGVRWSLYPTNVADELPQRLMSGVTPFGDTLATFNIVGPIEPADGADRTDRYLKQTQPARPLIRNDINPGVVDLWRVLAHERLSAVLSERLSSISYEQSVFESAKRETGGTMTDRAQRFLVKCRFSRGGLGQSFAWSKRKRGGRPGDENAWLTFRQKALPNIIDRARGVEVTNEPCWWTVWESREKMHRLIYADPPYMRKTRSAKKAYGPYDTPTLLARERPACTLRSRSHQWVSL